MRKFKSVLSEGEAATTAEEIGFFDGSDELFLLFAHKLEQAVLAKLHEQEPVVYRFLPPGTQQYMYITDDVPKIKEFEPLYAHPPMLIDHIPDAGNMVAPLVQRKTQSVIDRDGYRVIENATVLVNENGHAAIVNSGGAFYWVENEALAREYDGRAIPVEANFPDPKKKGDLAISIDTKEAQALLQSYLDSLDGWQLMPKKLTGEMHRSAVNFIENAPDCMWIEYISSLYNTLLATAPKPTEVDK